MDSIQELQQAAPLELGESHKDHLTEHALLAEFAPPFARGAPYLNRKSDASPIIAFQFSSEKLNYQKQPSAQVFKSGSASVAQTDKNGTTESETCQQEDDQRRE